MFKYRTSLNLEIFTYLCSIVVHSLRKLDFHMRTCTPIETRIAIALGRLRSDNTLQMCGEVFGVAKNTNSIIIKGFCIFIKKHLKPLVFEKSNSYSIKIMAVEFEALQEILYVIRAIDDNHIPIIAPILDSISNYYRKGLYSVLLQ